MRIFFLLFTLLLTQQAFSYQVTYLFDGTTITLPDPATGLDITSTAMTGSLSFDTNDFLLPGFCHTCFFDYEIITLGQTWKSREISAGRYLTFGNTPAEIYMNDDGPVITPQNPDYIYFRMDFSNPLIPGMPINVSDFIGGNFGGTHFLMPACNSGGVITACTFYGTIDHISLQTPIPAATWLFGSGLLALVCAGSKFRRV